MINLLKIITGESIDITEEDLSGLTFFSDYAFYGKDSIMSVRIPNNIKEISAHCFHACANLKTATIPNGVETIGESAFSMCSNLENAQIPNSVTTIEDSAFNGCKTMATVNVGSSVSSIGTFSFGFSTGAMAITDAYFMQPAGMTITLPTAGSSTGMFYVKTARSMNVYTDNETIKNYAWATDNITATLYHLDGTAW